MGLVILRLTGATPPMRRVLWPVLLGAVVALGVFAFNVLSHTLGTNAALWMRCAGCSRSRARRFRSGSSSDSFG